MFLMKRTDCCLSSQTTGGWKENLKLNQINPIFRLPQKQFYPTSISKVANNLYYTSLPYRPFPLSSLATFLGYLSSDSYNSNSKEVFHRLLRHSAQAL